MADQEDVRRLALALPGVKEAERGFAFSTEVKGKPKGFVWVWQERLHPRKARVPNAEVLAVRVADASEKAALLAADPEKFFTEPHYDGYPAVLVRLKKVTKTELRRLIVDAHASQLPAPKARRPRK